MKTQTYAIEYGPNHKAKIGDITRVKLSSGGFGDTRYEITDLHANGLSCFIKEVREGVNMAKQRFDTSLLVEEMNVVLQHPLCEAYSNATKGD